ncbi:MurR/RpiR family transcriptional regulator [Enterococcus sp. BWB1-3]|uniref:MurR/RpiR family transcriptional regulator n=1 Tax=unclassified Enterococcus TaxID=2608891 RepID=UPI001921BB5F|nr:MULTISPECIES: MurR/RpiR family transcriptional regulator [unclassified Enterococcus]MBL1228844.1 MurR/RpiR family transcriptional regulator [Enterococcus sp. BWB1-3]MCB5951613.1 MurR/RpiR family transcriptional regulator [Enterococcus sp. BWT-B8]
MFDLEKIQSLNDLELIVYQYIIEHLEQIPKLTIRELSAKCHVSTSTILRFCTKMDFEGFSELKFAVKKANNEPSEFEDYYASAVHVDSFLKKINRETYQETFKPAVDLILNARHVVFIGLGTSGVLGGYGSRYFANIGINAYSVGDPFTPIPPRGFESTLVVVLSVSGETSELIKMVLDFKKSNAHILSITNDETSTIARLADYNISYYMPDEKSAYADPYINLTTQIPVIALIELLAHQAGKQLSAQAADK